MKISICQAVNGFFVKKVIKNMCKTYIAPFKIIFLILFLEGVLILRNSSLKLKMVVDNANLLNYAVSSENISKCIKSKTENSFHLKRNVCKFRRNKSRTEK